MFTHMYIMCIVPTVSFISSYSIWCCNSAVIHAITPPILRHACSIPTIKVFKSTVCKYTSLSSEWHLHWLYTDTVVTVVQLLHTNTVVTTVQKMHNNTVVTIVPLLHTNTVVTVLQQSHPDTVATVVKLLHTDTVVTVVQ